MLRHPKTISLRLELFRVIFTFHSFSSVDAEIKRDEQWNEVGSSFARASCSIGLKHNIFASHLISSVLGLSDVGVHENQKH